MNSFLMLFAYFVLANVERMNQFKELEVIPDVVDHLPRQALEVYSAYFELILVLNNLIFGRRFTGNTPKQILVMKSRLIK